MCREEVSSRAMANDDSRPVPDSLVLVLLYWLSYLTSALLLATSDPQTDRANPPLPESSGASSASNSNVGG